MLKRYDAFKDEFVELDQEYFDRIQKQFTDMMFHYSKHSPENYKKFCDNFTLTGKT